MTKQEEIREGMAQIIFERFTRGYKPWDKCTQKHKDIFLRVADKVMEKEHSQGVVIKVERELPDSVHTEAGISYYQQEILEKILKKVGYVATVPLIKE